MLFRVAYLDFCLVPIKDNREMRIELNCFVEFNYELLAQEICAKVTWHEESN